jgi:D-3-phosphoglycerate dehydrogenase
VTDIQFNSKKLRGSILIIDDMHSGIVPGLQKLGFIVDYRPEISRNDILEIIPEYLGLVIRSKTDADKELIDKARKLKFIARAGAGTDRIDTEYCQEKNIIVLNSPEGNKDALGEHAAGMLLALFNHMHTGDSEIRNHVWRREENRGTELHSKTVGIVGYGNMGSSFARRLSGFSCTVLAYDKYKTGYEDIYARESTLEELYSEADVVSLHVPLTPETRNFYNFDFFSRFHRNVWLINTARGNIVPLADLVKLLSSGKVLGAALDVLENETLSSLAGKDRETFGQLIKFDNVILTPHVGGWTHESYRKINEVLIEKIGRLNIF